MFASAGYLRKGLMCLLALALWLPAPSAAAVAAASAGEIKTIALAEKYYRTDKRRSFAKTARRLGEDSVYQPIAEYWGSIIELRRGKTAALEEYIAAGASPFLQQAARRRLLEYYAGKKQWPQFNQHAEAGGACAAALAQVVARTADETAVRALWQGDIKMDKKLCRELYRYAHARDIISRDDVWVKLRALAGNKHLSASRRLLSAFPGFISYKKVRSVTRRATRYIKAKHGLNTRASRELVMIAAMVAARRSPKTALARWEKFSPYFSPEENDHVWTALATWAARWHRDDALQIYARTSGAYGDEQSRAWRARAALRAGDYAEVLQAIDAMPAEERGLSAWRYWRAIALQKAGQAAKEELAALAREEDDFYGLLAREAVGAQLIDSKPPPPQALAAAESVGGDFKLAVALHQAGLKSLARSMWRHAARREEASALDLMAAAHFAAQAEWPLASIDAAIRADHAAAHHWRYPFLYKNYIQTHSKKRGLDLAFVYGLIHQESRFMPAIVSPAKARGLMQVIPRTARSVARANGYSKYRLSRLTRVDTNVTIGTAYLHSLASDLNASPAMVAAAYNAGPGRVKRWYRASPETIVAIENIPITETRLYVKYLLANRLHYAARLGLDIPSMQDSIHRPMQGSI